MKRVLGRIWAARSSLAELAGFALLSAAAWRVSIALGLAAAGAALVFVGYASDLPRGRR